MLTNTLSSELVKRVSGITKNPIAVLDLAGDVLAKSENFKYSSSHIDVKHSKKAITLSIEGEKVGYIFMDAAPHVISDEGDILKSMAELILHQKRILENITTEDRKINKFVYDLLHREDYDESEAIAEARVYGFDLKVPRAVLLIDLGGEIKNTLYSENLSCNEKDSFWAKIRRSITYSTTSFYTRNKDNIIAYIGGSRFVIMKDLGLEDELKTNFKHLLKTLNSFQAILKSEFRGNVTIGVGKHYSGVMGLKESYEEALVAMNFGEKVWGHDKVYSFDSFGVVAPLINSGKGLDFPKNIFEGFSNEELKNTLNIFFDSDMSLTATAKKLKIHRNTLVYRLDKITENLKLDPRTFDDAIQIKLSMLFRELVH
jgi:carbohydrate diacid regulator